MFKKPRALQQHEEGHRCRQGHPSYGPWWAPAACTAMPTTWFGVLDMAKHMGATKVYLHCIMDGRDTDPHSGKGFLADLQAKLDELGIGQIATVSGRYYAMDRDNNWDREEKAYCCLRLRRGQPRRQRPGGHRRQLCRRCDR